MKLIKILLKILAVLTLSTSAYADQACYDATHSAEQEYYSVSMNKMDSNTKYLMYQEAINSLRYAKRICATSRHGGSNEKYKIEQLTKQAYQQMSKLEKEARKPSIPSGLDIEGYDRPHGSPPSTNKQAFGSTKKAFEYSELGTSCEELARVGEGDSSEDSYDVYLMKARDDKKAYLMRYANCKNTQYAISDEEFLEYSPAYIKAPTLSKEEWEKKYNKSTEVVDAKYRIKQLAEEKCKKIYEPINNVKSIYGLKTIKEFQDLKNQYNELYKECTGTSYEISESMYNGKLKLIEEKIEEKKKLITMENDCYTGAVETCKKLGNLYRSGYNDSGITVVPNSLKAEELWLIACKNGNGEACYELTMFYSGEDESKAKQFKQKACDNGYTYACRKDSLY